VETVQEAAAVVAVAAVAAVAAEEVAAEEAVEVEIEVKKSSENFKPTFLIYLENNLALIIFHIIDDYCFNVI
jgi:hypothetical protein